MPDSRSRFISFGAIMSRRTSGIRSNSTAVGLAADQVVSGATVCVDVSVGVSVGVVVALVVGVVDVDGVCVGVVVAVVEKANVPFVKASKMPRRAAASEAHPVDGAPVGTSTARYLPFEGHVTDVSAASGDCSRMAALISAAVSRQTPSPCRTASTWCSSSGWHTTVPAPREATRSTRLSTATLSPHRSLTKGE